MSRQPRYQAYGATDAAGDDSNGTGGPSPGGRGQRNRPQHGAGGYAQQRNYNNQQQQEQQYQVTEYNELDLEEKLQRDRHDEVVRIEQDTREVHAAYQEVQGLVAAQQQGLNRAEGHIDGATEKVGDGVDELVEARKYQAAYRKKMCFLFIILAVILAVVVIVIVIMKSNNDKKN
jgi:hypothetical protein